MGIFKKVVDVPIDTGKNTFNFLDRKLKESSLRAKARYQFYDQFPTEIIERKRRDLGSQAGSTKHRVSMDDVMKKRGYKYDNNIEAYYMYSQYKFEDTLDRDIELKSTPKRRYEEIEAELREKVFPKK